MRKRKPPEPLTPLAQRIDAAVEQSGLTNEAIAERLDVTPGNVSHWRRGRHSPNPEQVEKLADLLAVPYYPLLTGRPDPDVIVAALQAAMENIRAAVLAGEDPLAAWERLLGPSGLLTPEQRAAFPQDPAELRAYLASPDGLEWYRLTPEQQQVLRAFLSQFSGAAIPRTTPAASPPPPEKNE